MIETLRLAGRDATRLAEIGKVASRFGIGALVSRLGLPGGEDTDEAPRGADLARRTRLALEALGPTYVKLGQILATRTDLLPPDWIDELALLHSSAPTLDFADLRPSVELALGQTPELTFAAFDPEPLAAASIAQVHRATLHDAVRLYQQRTQTRD